MISMNFHVYSFRLFGKTSTQYNELREIAAVLQTVCTPDVRLKERARSTNVKLCGGNFVTRLHYYSCAWVDKLKKSSTAVSVWKNPNCVGDIFIVDSNNLRLGAPLSTIKTSRAWIKF